MSLHHDKAMSWRILKLLIGHTSYQIEYDKRLSLRKLRSVVVWTVIELGDFSFHPSGWTIQRKKSQRSCCASGTQSRACLRWQDEQNKENQVECKQASLVSSLLLLTRFTCLPQLSSAKSLRTELEKRSRQQVVVPSYRSKEEILETDRRQLVNSRNCLH